MKRLLLLALALALVPIFSPAAAHSATLAQRGSALEAKLACVTRVPVNEFLATRSTDDELIGENATNVYDEADSDNPDSLTDLGSMVGLDWDFGATPSFGFWVLTVKNTSNCRSKSLDANSELVGRSVRGGTRGGGGRNEKSRPLSRQLRAALSGESASVGRAAARPSARESAIDEKQKDRSRNRSEPGAEVKELIDRISEAERLDDQPADECAGDPNQRCDDETPGIVSGKQCFCDNSGE
jgi:hypothetical protein